MKNISKILVVILVLCALALPTGAAKSESEAKFEMTSGPITFDSAPTIRFGSQKIKARVTDYQAANITSNVIVTDARGTSSGWGIRGSLSLFSNSGAPSLKGASIIVSPIPPAHSNPFAKAPSKIPNTVELVSGDMVNHTLWGANQSEGNGQWNMYLTPETVKLRVANGSAELGTHVAIFHWTLIDAPAA